tara:strand:- start:2326 stop:2607 length:282 start_codon:yes stop_codon:yes gene_type:complete
MAVSIIAFDIPGSEITKNFGVDHKRTRATRRFLVAASGNETKDTVITSVQSGIGTTHPHVFGVANSGLPLQSLSARKAGRGRWIVDAQYFYPF